jgi:general secretion pathway protein M
MTGSLRSLISRIRLKSGLHRLEKRERWVLLAGIIFVTGFVLLQAVLMPYLDARSALASSLARKRQEVVDMALLQQEYRQLKVRQGGVAEQVARRPAGFSLFSYLETKASEARIRERVTSMKPSSRQLDEEFREAAVEMKIELVTLERLVDFMSRVESVEQVVVTRRLSIQQNSQEADLLDVLVVIATIEKMPPSSAGEISGSAAEQPSTLAGLHNRRGRQ